MSIYTLKRMITEGTNFIRMHLLETMPSSLPKLLNSVKWSHHKDVSVVGVL